LDPVSGDGKLMWLKGVDPMRPKYDLAIDFNAIAFNLDQKQYSTFISVFGALSRKSKASKFRKFRPPNSITPKLDPKAWLKYAGTSILSEIHEAKYKWTWEYFKGRRENRKRYIELFKKQGTSYISSHDVEELGEMEQILPFEDLRVYRLLANKEKTVTPTSATQKSTWVGWLVGSTPTAEGMVEDQLKELYDAFDLQAIENATAIDLNLTSVFLNFKCNISKGSFILKTKTDESIGELVSSEFQSLELSVIQYPKTYKIGLLVDDIVVRDSSTSKNRKMISAKRKSDTDERKFFTLKFEHLPFEGTSDDSLAIRMLPLKVIVLPEVMEGVFGFFKVERGELESITGLKV
jgi:vacuolar protein sorting-associated protein 13A/C